MGGSRASSGSRAGGGKAGRKPDYKYPLKGKAARAAEDVPCPARGKHDADCICSGTGKVKGTR